MSRRPPLKGWELVWMLTGITTFSGMVMMVTFPEQFRAAVLPLIGGAP